MELDVNYLQMLIGEDPVAADSHCFWTCGWSGGNVCGVTNPCGVTTASPCGVTTASPCGVTTASPCGVTTASGV